MIKCNTQASDMATTANNWQTPGASNPGRYTGEEEEVAGEEEEEVAGEEEGSMVEERREDGVEEWRRGGVEERWSEGEE